MHKFTGVIVAALQSLAKFGAKAQAFFIAHHLTALANLVSKAEASIDSAIALEQRAIAAAQARTVAVYAAAQADIKSAEAEAAKLGKSL